ncbi:hypothetical protein BZA05DRAFT_319208, partial [Tricharina praecox]|uniref:uncharacterized protein n=1 Tax=Tricharina praecox TaxID=43433 RepID=UPI00221FE6D4
WPAEIPASLYFSPGHGENGMGRFMRVVDYFWVDSPAWRGSGWRLVTPFLKSGTLETLAGLVHMCGLSPEDVDGIYRRRFRGVLMALKEMHTRGYTHDDVKTDNIFVAENGEFLLGDLGNVREHEHGYHSHAPDMHTGHKDYRQGDTERAVRSYLTFLRFACGDQRVFDRDFREMRAEWSEFFW